MISGRIDAVLEKIRKPLTLSGAFFYANGDDINSDAVADEYSAKTILIPGT